MMEDHAKICAVRNALCDALRQLLQAGIMGEVDFRVSRAHALSAVDVLDDLLREPDGDGA